MKFVRRFLSRSRTAASPPSPLGRPEQCEREHLDYTEDKKLDEILEHIQQLVDSVEPVRQAARVEQPRCNALEDSPFSKLPTELIQRITHFLAPGSEAAFSLCCTTFLSKLGSSCLTSLMPDDRYEFLALLERDLPEYIACQPCKKLHSIEKAHQYDWKFLENQYLGRRNRPCYVADRMARHGIYGPWSFSYPLFRMTMKLYRQGRDYTDLMKILCSSEAMTWSDRDASLQRCYLTRLVDGSLVIREQTIVLQRPENPEGLIRVNPYSALRGLYICPHRGRLDEDDFDSNWDALPRAGSMQLRNNCRQLMMNSCKYCTAEFRTDYKKLGKHGNALFVTKWKDLGEGRSSSDPIWQSHFPLPRYTELEPVEMEYQIGSIAAGFEGGGMSRFDFDTDFRFDALSTAQERKLLFQQRPFNERGKLKRIGDRLIELSQHSERLALAVSESAGRLSCF